MPAEVTHALFIVSLDYIKSLPRPGMVAHAYNLSTTWEVEAAGCLRPASAM